MGAALKFAGNQSFNRTVGVTKPDIGINLIY